MSYTEVVVAIDVNRDGWVWGRNISNFTNLTNTAFLKKPEKLLSQIKMFSASTSHVMKLTTDGVLHAMGANTYGQLGIGGTTYSDNWVQVATNVEMMDAEANVSAFVTKTGELFVMGRNQYNMFGSGSGNLLSPALLDTEVKQVQLDSQHMIWLKKDGTVRTMGRNASGQIGNGTLGSTNQSSPYTISGLSKIIQVGAGNYCSMAIDDSGNLYTWGSNANGRTGQPTQVTSPRLLMSDVKSAVMEYTGMGIIMNTDELYVTGSNLGGELGVGHKSNVMSPVKVLDGVKYIQIGQKAMIVLTQSGSIKTCGSNLAFMLGVEVPDETLSFIDLPLTPMVSLTGVIEIEAFKKYLIETIDGLFHFNNSAWTLIE